MSKKIIRVGIIVALLFSLTLTGCSKDNVPNQDKNIIRIAEQYGLAYAPLQIMKDKKILEKNLPGTNIEWKQLGNTAAIREAMVSNQLDIGFMAIPPFLIGWDNGMEWKMATGLSSIPVGLVTYKENIQSIKDFTKDDRIVLPQPGSVQHILLSMACENEFGDPNKLDDLLVTMSHPDGMNALLMKKDITAHFTSPPYLFKELEDKDVHEILTGREAMGKDFTFIIGVTTREFHENNLEGYNAFIKSVDEAIRFIKENPDESSEMLAKEYDLPKEEVLKYITNKETDYSNEIKGVKEFAQFMTKNNFMSKNLEDIKDVMWDEVKYEN